MSPQPTKLGMAIAAGTAQVGRALPGSQACVREVQGSKRLDTPAGEGSEIAAGVEPVGSDEFWLGLSPIRSPAVPSGEGCDILWPLHLCCPGASHVPEMLPAGICG